MKTYIFVLTEHFVKEDLIEIEASDENEAEDKLISGDHISRQEGSFIENYDKDPEFQILEIIEKN